MTSCRPGPRPNDARVDPAHRRFGDDWHGTDGPAVVGQPGRDGGRDVAAVERADVGGLGGVQQVAGGEDARPLGAQRAVDARRAAARHHRQPGAAGQLVVGDPVAGEDDRVAGEPATVGQLDRLDAPRPTMRADARHRSGRARGGGRR